MALSVMEETEMCRLIGKRSQSASCHETKGGSEEEKHSVFTLAGYFSASFLPSLVEDGTRGIGED